MTLDDYQMIRGQYSDIDGLCRSVETAEAGESYDAALRQLVQTLKDQQRASEQVRSFITHLGAPDDVVTRILGAPSPDLGNDSGFNLA